MGKHFLKILILLSLLVLFEKCAQVVPLTGGKKDETAPKLEQAIPANATPNFSVTQIVLKFDEFVKLKDLKNQLIITPGFTTEPEIEADGKKIKIILNREELLPNTTYRFYFGKSIIDMTEGNPVNDFEYVFSTGPYIDTLKIAGVITEALNNKGAPDILVGLYPANDNEDSLAFKKIPSYISRTNGQGEFKFGYLPKKSFKVIAFTDKNRNYIYDAEIEKIGFMNEDLLVDKDTNISLQVFKEEGTKLFVRKTLVPYYGKAQVIYNRKSLFKVKPINKENIPYIYEQDADMEKDTINLYYKDIKDTLKLIVGNTSNKTIDTLTLALPKLKTNKPKGSLFNTNINSGSLNPDGPLKFTFFSMIDTLKSDLRKMQLTYLKDSVLMKEMVSIQYTSRNKAELKNKLIEGVTYKLKMDTAAFYDVNGKYNDSLNINFKLQSKTEFGKVTLKMLLNKKQAYIIQLLNDKEQVIKQDFVSLSLSSSNATNIDFTGVAPGNYVVKVVYDDNENKKWDTGNYLLSKQAEKVFIATKQIKVMADWDVEEEILVK